MPRSLYLRAIRVMHEREKRILQGLLVTHLTSFSSTCNLCKVYIYIFEPFAGIFWQVSQFDKSINYGQLLFTSCEDIYGDSNIERHKIKTRF